MVTQRRCDHDVCARATHVELAVLIPILYLISLSHTISIYIILYRYAVLVLCVSASPHMHILYTLFIPLCRMTFTKPFMA